jgi:tetratricopeptide (TPR) repeat protein
MLYVFTLLGLMVSMAALYGHMAISFTSRLIVEAVSTGDDAYNDGPRLGPVEALERQRDYEGALQECQVLARIYPREPQVHLHSAENLLHLGRPAEAAEALERALKYVAEPEKNLTLTNRLCEILQRDLDRPGEAARVLQQYLDRYPQTEYADSLRHRIDTAYDRHEVHVPEGLSRLEEAPVEEQEEQEAPAPAEHFELESMDAAPQAVADEEPEPEPEPDREPQETSVAKEHFSLAALEDAPLEEEEEERPQTSGPRISLQALDDAPLEDPDGPRE